MEIKKYIREIAQEYQLQNTTEITFRTYLQNLLRSLLNKSFKIIHESKQQDFGRPDFIVTKDDLTIGAIETKKIGDKDLAGENKNKEQFDKYKAGRENIIFTDYLDFRLYQKRVLVLQTTIGKCTEKGIQPLSQNFKTFKELIKCFAKHKGESIKNPELLAQKMASKAQLLCQVIEKSLEAGNKSLRGQKEAFEEILMPHITNKTFADMYAQTVAYGIFAARLQDSETDDFNRGAAAKLIPKTTPFLRNFFDHIAGINIEEEIKWIVDSLVEIFLHCDVADILKNYGKTTQMQDPIIHFYETFLTQYDPEVRKSKGVWYTPKPVVKFIVSAVDNLLKEKFNLSDGLANGTTIEKTINGETKEFHKVQILDPATGTGTFLAQIVKHIYNYKENQNQIGTWNNYIEEHLIPRLNGFELLMASYAMAHIKLDLLLQETTFKLKDKNQRLNIFLTNTLADGIIDNKQMSLPFAQWLIEESEQAQEVKQDKPVMCILGNPPYNAESDNKGEEIINLLKVYKKEGGWKNVEKATKLQERNPKWINDDYVKFIRYGEHLIEKNKEGILAYINPHGFLDGNTFRGMRYHLLKTFDTLYIIDLHGNARKKETAPDGSKDENVFDIRQGVSINIFVKTNKKNKGDWAKVLYSEQWGKRENKYQFLNENTLQKIKFKTLKPNPPNYFFVPKKEQGKKTYEKGFAINELFVISSVGITTAKDHFTIHQNKEKLQKTIEDFLQLGNEEAREKFNLKKDSREWKVSFAKQDLQSKYPDDKKIVKINYRPFDERYTFYTGKTKGFHCRARKEVMQHFLEGDRNNVGLVVSKPAQGGVNLFTDIFVINKITDQSIFSAVKRSPYIFPLYCYVKEIENGREIIKKLHNLKKEIIQEIAKNLGLPFSEEKEDSKNTFAPIDILDYSYAVLHSPAYREKYKHFLKIDFPRVPYPKDKETFWALVALGERLRKLHLLQCNENEFITSYPKPGNHKITNPITSKDYILDEETGLGKVYINESQYFGGVPKRAWEFYIGGYRPAQKWLKDRRGKFLEYEDIEHYQKIIVILSKTAEIMQEIDNIKIG